MLSKPSEGSAEATSQQSLYGWRDINGGIEATTGSKYFGQRHVRFMRPVQVAARGNFIFVVDAGPELLYRYDMARNELQVVIDLKGVTAGEVTDLYVYPDHSFMLVDPDSARVLHFNRNGDLIRVFEDSLNLIRPIAVTYDEEMGRVLIADGSSDDILVFTQTGQLQGVIGTRGVSDGQFLNITAMTSGEGGIYVTSRLGRRVQVMGRDGAHLQSFQRDAVVFPLAVAVDRSGNTFVSDYLDNSIKVFQEGLFLESIAGSGVVPGRFKRISDLWYDQGFLYAVDSLNGRVQILRVEVIEAEPVVEAPVIEETSEVVPSDDEIVEADTASSAEVPTSTELELKSAQSELEKLQAELDAARAELDAAKVESESAAQAIEKPVAAEEVPAEAASEPVVVPAVEPVVEPAPESVPLNEPAINDIPE